MSWGKTMQAFDAETAVKCASLVTPYGGKLVDLLVPDEERDELTLRARHLPYVQLSPRALCDLELLAVGAFSPLNRFMNSQDYHGVVEEMRLAGGAVFPIPITLSVKATAAIALDKEIGLRNQKNELLATMMIEEVYEWDRTAVGERVFGTRDVRHPMIAEMSGWGGLNISGRIRVLRLPTQYGFRDIRLTPEQTRKKLHSLGYANVVAFQARHPLHRADEEFTKRAVQEKDGVLLLHPIVGMAKPGDVDQYTCVRTYQTMAERYYSHKRIVLGLLDLATRFGGPREALWHAIIRRNYGANHFIVHRDHASPGSHSTGRPFYAPYEAQELMERFSDEIGVTMLPFQELVYLPDEWRYEEQSRAPKTRRAVTISESQVREDYLNNGKALPTWFTRPEVAAILSETYPPKHRWGFCIWFTGLSGAGKSTTADILTQQLLEHGRQVTVLDGDVVRTHLSKGLGFSKEDRDTNVRRLGFVAAEVVRHGGAVVCAAVSPYRATRDEVRNMVGPEHLVEVFVSTPLEVCEQRDTKGMYAKARRGELKGFTGIDDLYEEPLAPDITLETTHCDPEDNVREIMRYLMTKGFLLDHSKRWNTLSCQSP
ncbi:bifunctional sulfate adenylyltransferase/adenylylsulfate kinase [Nitrospira japonica]|nr:bifunctional sulfate adenylyltransferase/adenylylsulfate kinase [Nitrospira japonica]